MSTLALFVTYLPLVALSLFDYTQQECDYINIIGVYSSSSYNNTEVLLIETKNERTENVYTTRACMPNPKWKIYDTRNTNNIKYYGQQTDDPFENPECLLDRTYKIPKASNSTTSITDGDNVSLKLKLYVTENSEELACEYDYSGLISEQDICEQYVKINNLYFMDGDNTADTIIINISSPYNQYQCSYFSYPTFKIYNNVNNKSWGRMDDMSWRYCTVSGEYIMNRNETSNGDINPDEEVSIRIELWNNWAYFACGWEWNGIIGYNGSIKMTMEPTMRMTMEPTMMMEPTMNPTTGKSMNSSLSPTEGDVGILPTNGNVVCYYNIATVVLLLLSLVF